MTSMSLQDQVLDEFLKPLRIDLDLCHQLSNRFLDNFTYLAAQSPDQFLPTPISESILRPIAQTGHGRYKMFSLSGEQIMIVTVPLTFISIDI